MTLKEMVAQKAELIELKKAAMKYSDAINFIPKRIMKIIDISKDGIKTVIKEGIEDTEKMITRTIVGNTYNYLDGHGDVHVKGCFVKSIKEREDKIFHLHDHEYKLVAKIGNPQKIKEIDISWKELGVDAEGETTVLAMTTEIMKDMNKVIFNDYAAGKINQHSVGMRYIKLELAVNDAEEKEEFAVWQKHIDNIANKEEAESQGFFWVVKEAALYEISAVLMGSNPITPTLQSAKATVPTDEEVVEALSESKKQFYKHLI